MENTDKLYLMPLIYRISNDDRQKGKKLKNEDLDKLDNIVKEWDEVLTPLKHFFHNKSASIIDIFFNDYESAYERLTDEGADAMSKLGESLKKLKEHF